MYKQIKDLAFKYHQDTIKQRRDFHHYAERGWLEIRTAWIKMRVWVYHQKRF